MRHRNRLVLHCWLPLFMLGFWLGLAGCGAAGSTQRANSPHLTANESHLIGLAAEKYESTLFRLDDTIGCATEALGSVKISSNQDRFYLLVLCVGHRRPGCAYDGEWLAAAKATLDSERVTSLSVDRAPYDPPYFNWIEANLPRALWQRANNPTAHDSSLLNGEVGHDVSC